MSSKGLLRIQHQSPSTISRKKSKTCQMLSEIHHFYLSCLHPETEQVKTDEADIKGYDNP